MAVIRLDIADFRNIVAAKLKPLSSGFNFIYGNNGSGKTSLLEAIYYLSLGKSFRSTMANRIIRDSADKFSLFSQVATPNNQLVPVGVERVRNGDFHMRISGNDAHSFADLAQLIPVRLINSYCYNLLEAPGFRRKYLDWGAFYFSADFLRIWKSFMRALRQRNAALRGQLSYSELSIWTRELIDYALQLDCIRRHYLENLIPVLQDTLHELLIIQKLEMSYQPGWNETLSYADILTESRDKDRALRHTQFGPHRADFKIQVKGMPAKDILSRGQQKLFVCAMILAQGTLLQMGANKKPIYLVDDLPAELDATSRSHLMSLLLKQNAQVFITAVEREALENFGTHNPSKMFHVEHGSIAEV